MASTFFLFLLLCLLFLFSRCVFLLFFERPVLSHSLSVCIRSFTPVMRIVLSFILSFIPSFIPSVYRFTTSNYRRPLFLKRSLYLLNLSYSPSTCVCVPPRERHRQPKTTFPPLVPLVFVVRRLLLLLLCVCVLFPLSPLRVCTNTQPPHPTPSTPVSVVAVVAAVVLCVCGPLLQERGDGRLL
jgi:hypothetical protein